MRRRRREKEEENGVLVGHIPYYWVSSRWEPIKRGYNCHLPDFHLTLKEYSPFNRLNLSYCPYLVLLKGFEG